MVHDIDISITQGEALHFFLRSNAWKAIAAQDDAAPDAREYFYKDLQKITGLSPEKFFRAAKRIVQDNQIIELLPPWKIVSSPEGKYLYVFDYLKL